MCRVSVFMVCPFLCYLQVHKKHLKRNTFLPALRTRCGIRHIKGVTKLSVRFRKSLFFNSNVTTQLNFQSTTGLQLNTRGKHSTINSSKINLNFIFQSNNNFITWSMMQRKEIRSITRFLPAPFA